jgi:hypothetical protein
LCDRYGFELKGTGYLAQWEGGSRAALAGILRQSLASKQPVSISSLGRTPDGGLVEMETVLAPVTFGGDIPTRFIGIMQVLSEPSPLPGRPVVFQRLVASQFVQEGEPLTVYSPPPPPPPGPPTLRSHPKAPHLKLIVSRPKPLPANFDMDESMQALIKRLDIGAEESALLVQ